MHKKWTIEKKKNVLPLLLLQKKSHLITGIFFKLKFEKRYQYEVTKSKFVWDIGPSVSAKQSPRDVHTT